MRLRSSLAAGGVAALVGVGAWLGRAGFAQPGPQVAWLVAGAAALLGAALLRGGGRGPDPSARASRGAVALGAAAGVLGVLAISWNAAAASFPYVDTARPWGMDWSPTPVARPTIGLLVLLVVAPAALAGRRFAWVPGLLACTWLVGWWCFPRWYEMDLLAREGIVPNLPAYLPQPGVVGPGDTPAVLGGRLVHVNWTQYAYPSAPARAFWYVLHRELAVGALAHGMHVELAQARVAAGTLAAETASWQASARATLWHAQRGATAAWLYTQAAAVPLAVLLAGRLLSRAPGPRWSAGTRWVVLALLCGPAVANLLLLAAITVTGLPDATGLAGHVLLESVATLGCVGVLDRAGRTWAATAATDARLGLPSALPPPGAEQRLPEGGRGDVGESLPAPARRGEDRTGGTLSASPSAAPSQVAPHVTDAPEVTDAPTDPGARAPTSSDTGSGAA